jgi:hypothetical protein
MYLAFINEKFQNPLNHNLHFPLPLTLWQFGLEQEGFATILIFILQAIMLLETISNMDQPCKWSMMDH